MFNVFSWTRAVPATPEEPVAAFVIVLASGAVFAIQGEARPPRSITGLPVGSLALRPAPLLFPGFGGDLAVLVRRR